MEIIYRKLEELKKLENNPRTISDEQLDKLKVNPKQSGLFRSPTDHPVRPYWRIDHYSRKPKV